MFAEVELASCQAEAQLKVFDCRMVRPSAGGRLLAGAAEAAEQWERLRLRLAPPPARRGPNLTKLYQAYEEATGTCLGCD
jgi:hypothetical protein